MAACDLPWPIRDSESASPDLPTTDPDEKERIGMERQAGSKIMTRAVRGRYRGVGVPVLLYLIL